MPVRIGNPAVSVPGAMDALKARGKAGARGDPPTETVQLVPLRAGSPHGSWE